VGSRAICFFTKNYTQIYGTLISQAYKGIVKDFDKEGELTEIEVM